MQYNDLLIMQRFNNLSPQRSSEKPKTAPRRSQDGPGVSKGVDLSIFVDLVFGSQRESETFCEIFLGKPCHAMDHKRGRPRGEQPSSAAQPAQKKRKESSAEQPACVPEPVPDAVCFLTYRETPKRLHWPEPKLAMLLSLGAAVASKPTLLVICLQNAGGDLRTTKALMEEWAAEIHWLHSKNPALSLKLIAYGCVDGLIHFDFQPCVRMQLLDPENGFPAMLLSVNSLLVVAASWPQMPLRTQERVIMSYIKTAMNRGQDSAAQPVSVVVGGDLNMDNKMKLGHLANKCACESIHNGSLSILLPDINVNVSFLKIDEPCVCLATSLLPPRQSVTLTPAPRGAHIAQPPPRADRGHHSAEQPVRKVFALRACTPLFDNFLDCMHGNTAGAEIMNFLADNCFYKDLLWIDERGNQLDTPRSLGFKMEVMMETVLEIRRWYVDELARKRDPRVPAADPESVLNSLTFTGNDMKILMNEWRQYVSSWMNPNQEDEYWRASSKRKHNMQKSGFSVYLQHLSGCKFFLRRLIALPLLTVTLPVSPIPVLHSQDQIHSLIRRSSSN